MLRIKNFLILASLLIILTGCLEVTITKPAPGKKVSVGKSIRFTAIAEDVDYFTKARTTYWPVTKKLEWLVDGVLDKGQVGRVYTATGLTVGKHTITARGGYTLPSGKHEQSEDSITVEITKNSSVNNKVPVVTITKPSKGQEFTPGQVVRFSGKAMDKEDGAIPPSQLTWKTNGQVIQSGTDTISHILNVNNTTSRKSKHVITLEAVDSAGGVAKKDITVFVINEKPVVTITRSSGTIITGQPITFTASAIDPEDGQLGGASFTWTFDGQPILANGNTLNISNVSTGTHTIRVEAKDQYGFVGRRAYKFIPKPPGTNSRGFRTFTLTSSARDVTDIVAEPYSNFVLLATNGDGLIRLNPLGKETPITFASTQGELPSDDITSLGRTSFSVWAGTAGHGMSRTLSSTKWRQYSQGNGYSMGSDVVFSIAVDTESKWTVTGDNVYFGTDYGFENYLNSNQPGWAFDQYYGPRNHEITDIAIHKDIAWIGSDGDGLHKYFLIGLNEGPKFLPGTHITSVEIDRPNGYIFAGTMHQGLGVYDPVSQAFAEFTTSNSSMPSDNITDIAVTPNGTAYIGTRSHGLVKLSGFNGSTGTIVTFNTNNSGIKDNEIVSVAVDPDNGNVWIGHHLGRVSLLVP